MRCSVWNLVRKLYSIENQLIYWSGNQKKMKVLRVSGWESSWLWRGWRHSMCRESSWWRDTRVLGWNRHANHHEESPSQVIFPGIAESQRWASGTAKELKLQEQSFERVLWIWSERHWEMEKNPKYYVQQSSRLWKSRERILGRRRAKSKHESSEEYVWILQAEKHLIPKPCTSTSPKSREESESVRRRRRLGLDSSKEDVKPEK